MGKELVSDDALPQTAQQLQHLEIEGSPSWASVTSWMLGDPMPNEPVVLTSVDHTVIHSWHSIRMLPVVADDEGPDFFYLKSLLGPLLLSTILAFCSAWDANYQCRSIEADEVYKEFNEGEDDENVIDGSSLILRQIDCQHMFHNVMIPVGISIIAGVSLSFCILRRHLAFTKEESLDCLAKHAMHYGTCLKLVPVFVFMLLAWTYGIFCIMIRPRQDEYTDENPFSSLAAVDAMGHVGDNANLYYTSWISQGLAMALVYQIISDAVQQRARSKRERLKRSETTGDVEAMLPSLGLDTYRESHAAWYQTLYRLRIRTGMWSATLITTIILLFASVHIWRDVLIPAALKVDESGKLQNICSTLVDSSLPRTLCARTSFSVVSGSVAAFLSFGAIVMHLLARRDATKLVNNSYDKSGDFLPLKSEFLLAVVLSTLLGLNAVFATAVQGPAATVGNLYYASWMSFLLCLRISLGCLEQLCNIDQEHNSQSKEMSYNPPSIAGSENTNSTKNQLYESYMNNSNDLMDNERALRTRKYLILAITSTVCSASAYDAAMSQEGELDWAQRFVIVAPSLIAVICACQFLLCLQKQIYHIVSQMWLGGLISIATFGICMATLVITMHSESSWAVNAIGEIQYANLYYFVWASIFTAGLQMASYLEKFIGLKSEEYTTAMWVAIGKVCFVILGGGYHIWRNISSTCTLDDIRSRTVTFCSRTILAIAVSFTGMFVTGLVTSIRILFALRCAESMVRPRAHLEMVVSLFLVLLFGVALALITGIGGPGESVGDLFYGSWLAFLISIVLVRTCFEEIRKVDAGGSSPTLTGENSIESTDIYTAK